ncbi:ectomycorrhiza-regulated small secreted protein [Lyophyllum atratum]|nr:ectomycorrhiza-regulated small secreted protein [Lyophyllum atratum]
MVFFSTPAQTRSPTPPPITLTLHPLLLYSQHDILRGHCTSLLWDLRETPRISVRHVAPPHITLTKLELAQYATVPRMPSLYITCGILPGDWTMKAYNPEGLTLLDVLDAIHDCLKVQLTGAEWDAISHKQRGRISAIFDLRWRLAPVPSKAHSRGVLRADCLLNHTIFGGLTPSPVSANKCILTLRRPSPKSNLSNANSFLLATQA